uniref:Leucine-rich repeat and WD repeat-containing protein 1 WD domain-containing protein n=1 Tax=Graphocephala atropunctata TaxID=36148 RepID=A0A1B6KS80_9HEMI
MPSNEKTKPQLDYDPVHFLRCHSKKNDASDVQTQVWQCAFEPNIKEKQKTTSMVATCGGNSVCFIDVKTGNIPLKYYAKDVREMLYALAWTTNGKYTFLVTGGIRYTIHFIHPAEGIAFFCKTIKVTKYKNHINSLLFHPKHWNLLICGGSHGEIHICNIGNPKPPQYEMDFNVMQSFSTNSEVFSMSFCPVNHILLTGCNDGLQAWCFPDPIEDINQPIPVTCKKLELPARSGGGGADTDTQDLVDSVEVVGDGVVATKCALHGAIYLWNLTDTLARQSDSPAVKPTHVLRWSDTDNYFMFIGVQAEAGLLCCGDDKGMLWLYDLEQLSPPDPQTHKAVQPSTLLPWPELTDRYTEKKRKLSVETYDIVIDKVTLSSDREYIVAVTNNNMVCIWKQVITF